MVASRLSILALVLVFSTAFLSCGDGDTGVGIDSTEESDAVTLNQVSYRCDIARRARNGMRLFFVGAGGDVLFFEYVDSREDIAFLLSVYRVKAQPAEGICEIYDEEAVAEVAAAFCGATLNLGSVSMIGIVSTFEECMVECIGDNPSWGRIKKCLTRCTEDHDPKLE